ncbi:tyrosine-type recombinase/integrase [Pseudomonas aeruginosa]|nr:tyrosine-type recombinase/integrase [Pseudomonas aeruginosa]MDP5806243.1 tyrosine-type recombinase/integrase [Pseudomonas aeruginosa]
MNQDLQDITDTPIPVDPASLDFKDRQALYFEAGRSKNTSAAYQSAIRHFQNVWGGFLPATEAAVVGYLTTYAPELTVSTLDLRLAALAKWHKTQGFPDPTKGEQVKRFLSSIRTIHGTRQKQAIPLSIEHLRAMVASLEAQYQQARAGGDLPGLLRASRDKALLLIGFWRGFRSDELRGMTAEGVTVYRGSKMAVFVRRSKTDLAAIGKTYEVPALIECCPVEAYSRWIEDAGISHGAVFRSIANNGRLGAESIDRKSVGRILTKIASDAQIEVHFTSHSMRSGFANWAIDQGWSLKDLMEYVGWKGASNAARYVGSKFNFGPIALAQPSASSVAASVPTDLSGSVLASLVTKGQ